MTQVWVTNRLGLRYGPVAAIMFLPIVSAVGYFAIEITQVLEAHLFFIVICRVGEYAISKSACEVLFTVVSREEKYKAKNFIAQPCRVAACIDRMGRVQYQSARGHYCTVVLAAGSDDAALRMDRMVSRAL